MRCVIVDVAPLCRVGIGSLTKNFCTAVLARTERYLNEHDSEQRWSCQPPGGE